MIKYIVKFLLVILMLGGFTPIKSYAQNLNDITSEQLDAFQEIAEDYVNLTKSDFDGMYNYEASNLNKVSDPSYSLYLEALERIKRGKKEVGSINDPGLEKDYNIAYEGKIDSSVMTERGEFGVAWSGGHPIVITSEPLTFERTLYIPKGVDRNRSSFRRLIYHLHVFSGDNGFGISDVVKTAKSSSFLKRTMSALTKLRKKHFVRGVDVKLVSLDINGKVENLELSKKPKYMSAKHIMEWWGAMNHGRPATWPKVKKALVMAGFAGGLSLVTTNPAMASVMAGLTLVSYTFYEGYLTFKFSHSTVMQIAKLTALTLFSGTLYVAIHSTLGGGVAEWQKMFENTIKAVAIFYTASYSKQLLILSNKVTKEINVTRVNLFRKIAGKKVSFLGVSFKVPKSIGIGNTKMSKSKFHDMIQDSIISLGRQADLVYDMGDAFIPAILAVLHVYAKGIYYGFKLNKKPLNPKIEAVNDEIFYKKIFKSVARTMRSGCSDIYKFSKTHTF